MTKARNIADLGSNDVLDTDANGVTVDGNVTLGDNDKAIFGDGSDLQIYHDGNNSFITDFGTGYLHIRSSTEFKVQNASGSVNHIKAVDSGAVELFHNGGSKLATTSTGIDVTGTVMADGLETVSGVDIDMDSVASGQLRLDGDGYAASIALNAQGMNVYTNSSVRDVILGTNETQRLRVEGNGDISFYDDQGSSQKLFWDASAESLGIGVTGTPARTLHINRNDGTGTVQRVENTGASAAVIEFMDTGTTDTVSVGSAGNTLVLKSDDGSITLNTTGDPATESMVIARGGNVGINEVNPEAKLHVTGPQGPLANTWYRDSYAGAVFEDVESRIQLASEDTGGDAASIVLSAGAKYWTMAMGGPDNSNELRFIYGVATADGNLGSASQNPFLSVDTSGRIKTPSQPAFYGYRNSTYSLTSGSGDTNLSVNVASVNRGNHFSTSTSRFTAPVSGLYKFDVHLTCYTTQSTALGSQDDSMNLSLSVNGTGLGRNSGSRAQMFNAGMQSANGVELGVSFSAILNLSAGDYVQPQMTDVSVPMVVSNTNFCGYLLG
jgi:hypothetical protein